MKHFSQLLADLQGAADDPSQLEILRAHLQTRSPAESRAVCGLLAGELPAKMWTSPKLKALFLSRAGLPEWLWERCLKEGADVAETLARCWPREGGGLDLSLATFLAELLPSLTGPEAVTACWDRCRSAERIWINRLLLGRRPLTLPESVMAAARGDPLPALPDTCPEAEVELMYVHFPEFSFGQEQAGVLQLFARVRVEDPALLKVLLNYTETHLLEKKGPVQLVKRGLRGRIRYQRKTPSPRHKSGFKVEGAVLVQLTPPGELWALEV